MEPILKVGERQAEPYFRWKERQTELSAGQEETSGRNETVQGASKVQGMDDEQKSRPVRRERDEYIPSEQHAKRADGKKPEICKGNTDQVDREIEKLKKKKEELESRLRTETDEGRIADLEKELAQVERELNQKDNDAYRRQHTKMTQM